MISNNIVTLIEADERNIVEIGNLNCSVPQRVFTNSPTWALMQTGFGDRKNIKTTYAVSTGNKVVGMLTIEDFETEYRLTDLLIDISEQHKGYATGAVHSALWMCSEQGKHEIAVVHISPENIASQRLAEKCGFVSDGLRDVGYSQMLVYTYRFTYAAPSQGILADSTITADNYTERNAEIIGNWTDAGWPWGIPITHEVYSDALNGKWDVLLTPTKFVPHEWFPELRGAKLLGLASAGGQQMPIFAALGADCTLFDITEKMIEKDREVMAREGFKLNIVQGDMTKRLPFDDESFDVIFHPVSNCYIEDVRFVWHECYRVLKPGGILLAGLDNGISFLYDDYNRPLTVQNTYPFNPLKNPEQMKKLLDADDGIQFSHSIDEQIGGQIEAGFTLTHVFEDFDLGADPGDYPGYWATRAVK